MCYTLSQMRKETFENGEYYHIYNRGVDKRIITLDKFDSDRFIQGLIAFNTQDGIGSIRDIELQRERGTLTIEKEDPLVKIIAYCLNPNHFHLILKQLKANGISLFLHSEAGGYAKYFNRRHCRTGALFEGKFKSKWIEDVEELKYKSVYVNLNNRVHKLADSSNAVVRSSWNEFKAGVGKICKQEDVLKAFNSIDDYIDYAESTLLEIIEDKRLDKELKQIEFED